MQSYQVWTMWRPKWRRSCTCVKRRSRSWFIPINLHHLNANFPRHPLLPTASLGSIWARSPVSPWEPADQKDLPDEAAARPVAALSPEEEEKQSVPEHLRMGLGWGNYKPCCKSAAKPADVIVKPTSEEAVAHPHQKGVAEGVKDIHAEASPTGCVSQG